MKISRRNFIELSAMACSGVLLPGHNGGLLNGVFNSHRTAKSLSVFIPIPLQVVIDDVGWWSGEDGSTRMEPYRTGINRNHVPADYQAIADLGRSLGIRPQAAFILCEWDKENILRELPTSTWMGKSWNNSKWVGPWLDEAAEIIRNNHDHFELTIHGIGHEFWEGGTFTRAEWTDSKGQMRAEDEVEKHLEYFGKILDQHNLGPFPVSFVPAAFRHSFGPSDGRKISLAQILEKAGVTYINTPFSSIYHKERIRHEHFGFDSSVITIDRGNDEFPWLTFPAFPAKELMGPTCGLHWPNMLHPDPERNGEVVQKWVDYLSQYNDKADMMLARDSVCFQHQILHHTLTTSKFEGNSIELDFTETDRLPSLIEKRELTIKIITDKPLQFSSDAIDIKKQSAREGSELLYVLNLERKNREPRVRIRLN